MIVYTKEKDRAKLAEIIQMMGMDLDPLVAWEVTSSQGRLIRDVKLGEINNDKEEFCFKGQDLNFSGELIFFYSRQQKLIFKSKLVSTDGKILKVKIPDTIKLLEEDEKIKMDNMLRHFDFDSSGEVLELEPSISEDGTIVDSFGFANNHPEKDWLTKSMSESDAKLFEKELSYITLAEEDELFAGVRRAPRAKPPEGKMITVQVENDSRPQCSYMLYDLSRGGLSFLVFTKDEFSVGEKVFLKAFDTNKFQYPILTQVKALREADALGIQFKVGCEFLENEKE